MSAALGETVEGNSWTNSDMLDTQMSMRPAQRTGEVATEPPYADAELDMRHEVAQGVYSPMTAKARGEPLHPGPLKLRDALPPPDRLQWVRENKLYHPYSYFESPSNPLPEPAGKPGPPPKLWLPERAKEPKSRRASASAASGSGGASAGVQSDAHSGKSSSSRAAPTSSSSGDQASPAGNQKVTKKFDPPAWDTEHHVMVSRANSEVRPGVREYFDKPMRKDSEGVPKYRELYAMNDRQCGWNDEPPPLGQSRHTFLDWVTEYNVGGPKGHQLPSYWRKNAKLSASAPTLGARASKGNSGSQAGERTLLERLADMPAGKSTEFWRQWSESSELRSSSSKFMEKNVDVPRQKAPLQVSSKVAHSPKAERAAKQNANPAQSTRGGWPPPSHDPDVDPSDKAPAQSGLLKSDRTKQKDMHKLEEKNKRSSPKEPWDARFAVMASKDNERLTLGHKQLFSSAEFLSGAEMGHPGSWLGLPGNKWRNVARNVTISSSGAEGRGPVGRHYLLH